MGHTVASRRCPQRKSRAAATEAAVGWGRTYVRGEIT
ncbi:MAG: hypothetical protein IAE78_00825 [Myxococcus sp.]|nr:hypothetical protein [Myxococcus sp.]